MLHNSGLLNGSSWEDHLAIWEKTISDGHFVFSSSSTFLSVDISKLVFTCSLLWIVLASSTNYLVNHLLQDRKCLCLMRLIIPAIDRPGIAAALVAWADHFATCHFQRNLQYTISICTAVLQVLRKLGPLSGRANDEFWLEEGTAWQIAST